MSIQLNYKDLFFTTVKYMPKETLESIRTDILKRAGEIADLTMTTVPQMKELDNLIKQAQLISVYIRSCGCEFCDRSKLTFCIDCVDGYTMEE